MSQAELPGDGEHRRHAARRGARGPEGGPGARQHGKGGIEKGGMKFQSLSDQNERGNLCLFRTACSQTTADESEAPPRSTMLCWWC